MKKIVAAAIIVLVVVVALTVSYVVLSPSPAVEATYVEPASAVHAPLGKTVQTSSIALRLNDIGDASRSPTRDIWTKLNDEIHDKAAYNFSLTPHPGERYLVANVTVTNLKQAKVPFTYADFALIGPKNTAYYTNWAVCNSGCAMQAFKNNTLNPSFSNDMYILFSVPAGMNPAKLVYTGSNPPVVMSTAKG